MFDGFFPQTSPYFLHNNRFLGFLLLILSQGGGEETRSGTEKRCCHNLQSGHPAWWSADNYSIFPTVNILEARIEANRQRKSEMLKKLKKITSCNFVFLAYRICLSVLKCGETNATVLDLNQQQRARWIYLWLHHLCRARIT